uniref:ZP domain-containing protein n=1 Tax=Rhabditophanes sp. KR3021 TaxID=114890 RepID=A0AC35TJ39_9BILA
MENRVYVQMDTLTQTNLDHQYSFVCELAIDPIHSPGSIDPLIGGQHKLDTAVLNYRNLQFPLPHRPLPATAEPIVEPIRPIINDHITPVLVNHGMIQPSIDQRDNQVNKVEKIIPASNQITNNQITNTQIFPALKTTIRTTTAQATIRTTTTTQPTITTKDILPELDGYSSSAISDEALSTIKNEKIPKQTTKTNIEPQSDSSKSSTVGASTTVEDILPELETTNLIANQSVPFLADRKYGTILLEIQEGNGPFGNSVSKPLKIGDNLTLVVKGKTEITDDSAYNMFVHSCYASGGNTHDRVMLIDANGCAIHSQVVSKMKRLQTKNGDVIYYFKIQTFKFPDHANVYFACAVDTSSKYDFPQICSKTEGNKRLRKSLGDNDQKLIIFSNVTFKLDDSNLETVTASQGQVSQADYSMDYHLLLYMLIGFTLSFITLILLIFMIVYCCCTTRQTHSITKPGRVSDSSDREIPQGLSPTSIPVFSFDSAGKRKMSIFSESA